MANPSLQIGNRKWAIKEDNLLGYSKAGTRFVPQPITMTRESAGTRVNSSGLVETVELLGSDVVINGDFDTDSNWTKGTGWSISGGSANCDGSQSGTTSLTPSLDNVVNNVTYIVEYTISNYTSGSISIKLGNTGYGAVRTANGTYTEEIKAQATTFPRSQINADSIFVGSIDNVSVKESTKNNLARVDYDGTASSLLVEPERTNLITYSEDFENSGWGTYNSTLEADSVISPNGILNATKLIGTNDVTAHTLYTNAYTVVSGVDYTHSVFIKKSQSKYVQLYTGNGYGNYYANFNLEDGVVETFTTLDANIENIGGGWYKCSTKANSSTTTAQSTVALIDSATSGRGYAFNAENESVYIWGAQIEEGSYATSYIPTSGSTVTRVQDQYSKAGISNLINSEEGVLFLEIAALSDDGTNRLFQINDSTTSNMITLGYTPVSNQLLVEIRSGGGSIDDLTHTITDVLLYNKIALKWKENDVALWVNGVEVGIIPTVTMPIGLNKLVFDYNGILHFYGKVKQLQVFKTALTDTELATLTT